MTYDYVMARLQDMKPRFDAGFSLSDRAFLTSLHSLLYNRTITLTGCSDCYRDAYLVMCNYLKKRKNMPIQTEYRLLPGAIIHEFGSSDYYSHNVPTPIAEKWLKADPSRITYFDRYPENWEERISSKIEIIAAEEVAEEVAEEKTTPVRPSKKELS